MSESRARLTDEALREGFAASKEFSMRKGTYRKRCFLEGVQLGNEGNGTASLLCRNSLRTSKPARSRRSHVLDRFQNLVMDEGFTNEAADQPLCKGFLYLLIISIEVA